MSIRAFDLGDTRSPAAKARGVELIDSPFGVDALAAGTLVARGPIIAAEFEACQIKELSPGRYDIFVLTAEFMGAFLGGLRATHLLLVRSGEEERAVTSCSVRDWVKCQQWREVGGVAVDGGTAGFFDSAAPELYGLNLSELRRLLTSAKFERPYDIEARSDDMDSSDAKTTTMSLTFATPKSPDGGKGHKKGCGRQLLHQQPTTPRPTEPVILADVTRLLGRKLFASCPNLGVICSAGFGDGGYPVFVNGSSSGAIIQFIGADVLESRGGSPGYILKGDSRWAALEKETREKLAAASMKLGDAVVLKRPRAWTNQKGWVIQEVSGYDVLLRGQFDDRHGLRTTADEIEPASPGNSTCADQPETKRLRAAQVRHGPERQLNQQ